MSFKREGSVIILCFCIAVLASGCVASLNKRAPFKAQVRRDLTLREPAVIIMAESWAGADIYWKAPSLRKTLVAKNDALLYHYEPLQEIPAGAPLYLKHVKRLATGIGHEVIAIGVLYPGTENEVNFIYSWGSPDNLKRAPWE